MLKSNVRKMNLYENEMFGDKSNLKIRLGKHAKVEAKFRNTFKKSLHLTLNTEEILNVSSGEFETSIKGVSGVDSSISVVS
jgi:hypothetical protein